MEESRKTFSLFGIYMKSACALGLVGGFILLIIEWTLVSGFPGMRDIARVFGQMERHFIYFGWITLSLIGLTYYFLIRYRDTDVLARYYSLTVLWMQVSGVILRGIFQPLSSNLSFGTLAILGGLLEFAAALVYAYTIFILLRSGGKKRERYEDFIAAGCFWFFLVELLSLYGLFYMVYSNLPGFPDILERIINHVMLYGVFITTLIGISVRGVPEIMGFRPMKDQFNSEIFWLITLGIFLMSYSFIRQVQMPYIISGTMEFFGVMAFIYSLNIFRKMDSSIRDRSSMGYSRMIRCSYFWLTIFVFSAIILNYYVTITRSVSVQVYEVLSTQICIEGFFGMLIIGMCYWYFRVVDEKETRFFRREGRVFWLLNAGIFGKLVVLVGYGLNTKIILIMPFVQLVAAIAFLIFFMGMWRPAVTGQSFTRG